MVPETFLAAEKDPSKIALLLLAPDLLILLAVSIPPSVMLSEKSIKKLALSLLSCQD